MLYSAGNDIIVDLRSNNGATPPTPKFEDFWNVVVAHIDAKTAVDDRRHGGVTIDGDIVVNMALAGSLADLYRQCVKISQENNINAIPSYAWFLLQFCPSSATSKLLLLDASKLKGWFKHES